jgi:phenylalanyl-tRNA synthetase beta chain
MHTDASHRFERGTDPAATVEGLDRAAQMILESNGGRLAKGVIDVLARPIPRKTILLRTKQVQAFLGMKVPESQILEIFAGLGFTWEPAGDGVLSVTVPAARIDLEIEVDLIEEIIRHVGYSSLPETLPPAFNPVEVLPHLVREEKTRDLMAGIGLFEACTYAFVSAEENAPFVSLSPGTAPGIENPLGEPFTTMRATPLIGLLKSAQQNVRRGQTDLGLFEVSRSFGMQEGKPVESRRVAYLLSGQANVHWSAPGRAVDFFDGSGVASALLSGLGSAPFSFVPEAFSFLSAGRSARIFCGGKPVGWVGVLSPDLVTRWDLADPVAGEIDLGALTILPTPTSIEAPPRFPGSSVDLTITHPKAMEWRTLADVIRHDAPSELTRVEVLYQYSGQGVAEGHIKTTVSLAFGSAARSLSREEINGWRDAAARRILRVPETRVDGIDG